MLLCPALELREQTDGFGSLTDVAAQAAHFAQLGFGCLYIIDRDAQFRGTPFNLAAVTQVLKDATVPVWVGGGIKDLAAVRDALTAGAHQVVVGPSFWQQPNMLAAACKDFPGKILALVDAYAGTVVPLDNVAPAEKVLDRTLAFERDGVAGIIYMEHEREGASGGLDPEVIADLAFALTVPLYVTGGINAMSDLRALKAEAYTGIAGVILGRALVDGRIDPITALALLQSKEGELS